MSEEKLHRQLFQKGSRPAEDTKDTHKVKLTWQARPGLAAVVRVSRADFPTTQAILSERQECTV